MATRFLRHLMPFVLLVVLVTVTTMARATTVNATAKEIDVRVVYWGPIGTTESLAYMHAQTEAYASKLVADAKNDKLVSFNFVPENLGKIRDHTIRLHLWSAPASANVQLDKLIPDGVDGVVFSIDATPSAAKANAASLAELKKQLAADGYDFELVYLVVQVMNTRAKGAVPVAKLLKGLGLADRPHYAADAKRGTNIFPGLKSTTTMILKHVMADKPAPNRLPDAKLYR